ncbi:MAG: 50S ribosomal protein L11 methyltransferase [Bacteroidales bacterium]|nr:50S ribosomal protein L11 methyltransferase [Bacteroidales bacterium]
MKYTEVDITLSKTNPFRDLLVYNLGDEGPYDSFEEKKDGLKAYVPTDNFDEQFLRDTIDDLKSMEPDLRVEYTVTDLADKDYNEEWERQHQPVLVDGFCWVRAPFHPHRDDVKYEIEIEPKMSFGTAHHATTYLMLSLLEQQNVQGMRVLDMGSGTGVLAILAAKKGAAYVEAIDVDEWAYRNAQENFERNGVSVNALLGDASLLTADKHFDLVLANINRNILLKDMESYAAVLNPGGTLMLSGFYEHDVQSLQDKAETLGLRLVQQRSRNEWTALKLILKSEI